MTSISDLINQEKSFTYERTNHETNTHFYAVKNLGQKKNISKF